ncbi:MAG: hypothetical protein MUF42_14985 [Cytophagaceae bacterium]|jgi:hypothetical protein|nr:hypothetical protein [Cytophagaceae bacterium]
MKTTHTLSALLLLISMMAHSQSIEKKEKDRNFKYSINTTWLSLANWGPEKTNTQHYELHFKYKCTEKSRWGIKLATWKLFAPMGIPLWDPLFLKESEFYPGRLHEKGIGITYQHFIWKRLFTTIEVMPQWKTYRDTNKKVVGRGFKLYTSYHIGYHIPMFKNRFFIEPQLHGQYWPIDTPAPDAFREKDKSKNNFFLFEPNIYLGVKF